MRTEAVPPCTMTLASALVGSVPTHAHAMSPASSTTTAARTAHTLGLVTFRQSVSSSGEDILSMTFCLNSSLPLSAMLPPPS